MPEMAEKIANAWMKNFGRWNPYWRYLSEGLQQEAGKTQGIR